MKIALRVVSALSISFTVVGGAMLLFGAEGDLTALLNAGGVVYFVAVLLTLASGALALIASAQRRQYGWLAAALLAFVALVLWTIGSPLLLLSAAFKGASCQGASGISPGASPACSGSAGGDLLLFLSPVLQVLVLLLLAGVGLLYSFRMREPAPTAITTARRWVPVVIVGVPLALVVCGIIGVLILFALADTPGPNAGDAATVVQHYYTALQQADDSTAYSYLAPGAVFTINGQDTVVNSEQTFASLAQAADHQEGTITSFTASDETFEMGKPIVDMTMHVARASQTYDVHLQVDLSSKNGAILRADGL